MKKLSKKVSFLTKIFLVISILFSNLISLTNVFAYVVDETLQIAINDTGINVKYTGELDTEEDSVYVKLVENYTYLDDTVEQNEVEVSALVTDLTGDNGVNLTTILQNIYFDGLYEAYVEIYTGDTPEDFNSLLTGYKSQNIELDKGLELKVYNTLNEEVPKVSGVYNIDTGYTIQYRFLAGGLTPNKVYNYGETSYTGNELITTAFSGEVDLTGFLYGEHTLELNEDLLDEATEETISYTLTEKFMYKTYNDNSVELNDSAEDENLNTVFKFDSEEKEGTLYVYSDGNNHTVSEIIKVVNNFNENKEVTLEILDGDTNILDAYTEYLDMAEEETPKTIEEYFQDVELKENYIIKLSDEDSSITFKILYVGDIDGNGIVDSEDLAELINQVIGASQANLEKFDLVANKKLDLQDVIFFNEVINNNNWSVELGSAIGTLTGALQLVDEEVTTGDEFEVLYLVDTSDYQVNGIEALVTYDETKYELVKISNETSWDGNNYNKKILYIGNESLAENGEYSLFSLTFKAISSGSGEINVKNTTLVSGVDTLTVSDTTLEVIVNASSDNSLASLKIGDTVVELEENTLDYTVTVESYVEHLNIEALTNNIGANVQIDAEEELAYGENKVTITVTAENGDVKVYTITVIREEEKPVVTQTTYDYNYDDGNKGTEVTPLPSEPSDPVTEPVKEDKGILSKIIIIVLILIVIAGLVYLIFKDDNDTKKTNKEVNKLKKEELYKEDKPVVKTNTNNNTQKPKQKNTGKNNKNRKK